MPIDPVELMELMEKTVGSKSAHSEDTSGDVASAEFQDSYFQGSPAETSNYIVDLETLLSGNRDIFSALADRYDQLENEPLAMAVREIRDFLNDRATDLNEPEKQHKRLSNLVYPVI